MKMLSVLLLLAAAPLALCTSCNQKTNCYMCITGYSQVLDSFHYLYQHSDTVMECGMTSKDANAYETSHTYHSYKTGDKVKATSCYIPTE